MIEFCENYDFLRSLPNNYESVKIKSLCRSYGEKTDFLTLWKQLNDNGVITAVIMQFANVVTVLEVYNTDYSELKEFLAFLGKPVFGQKKMLEKLKLEISKTKYGLIFCGKSEPCSSLDLPYKTIYEVLTDSNSLDIKLDDFDSWYVDFCHRVRHKTARSFSSSKYSVAITGFETESSAIITGVATKNNYKNQGLARKNILGICNELEAEGKEIMLLCNKNLISFYKKLNFKIIGEYAISK